MRRDKRGQRRSGGTTDPDPASAPSRGAGKRSRQGDRHRLRPAVLYLEERRLLATFTVNSTGDSGTGSGTSGDLRYCINQANANNQANSIVFDSSVFGTAKTIALTGGQLELSDTAGTQTITGPAAGVTISGGGTSRVFQIDTNVSVGITGLTITQGNVGSGSGGGLAADGGGTVNVVDCTFSQNTASSHGGASA